MRGHRGYNICDLPRENIHQQLPVKTPENVNIPFITRFNGMETR